MIVVSLMTAGAEKDVSDLVWTPAFFRAETEELKALPLYKNYRVHAVGLLAIAAGIIIAFW